MSNFSPTKEQVNALKACREAWGRYWKSRLSQSWMSGRYLEMIDFERELQQVRNSGGPSWLYRYKLSK